MATSKNLKPKKCKACREEFVPARPLQSVCSMSCAVELNTLRRAKEEKAEAAQKRKEVRLAKEKAKTRGQWLKEAQAAFNRYIRVRDADLPCISCGRMHQGQYHAGHYRATSVSPELRFHEINVHKQCAPCNDHLHGNLIEYRIGLVKRIGIELVEWLEGANHPAAHYSIGDLMEIKRMYGQKARELEKHRGL